MPGRAGGEDTATDSSLAAVSRLTRDPLLAVELRPPLPERIRSWWTAPRLLVMVPAWAGLAFGLAADGAGVPLALAVVVAFAAALSLTSYVPAAGQSWRESLGSPCAAVGGVVPMVCAFIALGTPGLPAAVLALALAGFALSRRFTGTDSCGSRP